MTQLTRNFIVLSKSQSLEGFELKLASAVQVDVEGVQTWVQESPGAWMNLPATAEEAAALNVGDVFALTLETPA